jgi:hypothetical protein
MSRSRLGRLSRLPLKKQLRQPSGRWLAALLPGCGWVRPRSRLGPGRGASSTNSTRCGRGSLALAARIAGAAGRTAGRRAARAATRAAAAAPTPTARADSRGCSSGCGGAGTRAAARAAAAAPTPTAGAAFSSPSLLSTLPLAAAAALSATSASATAALAASPVARTARTVKQGQQRHIVISSSVGPAVTSIAGNSSLGFPGAGSGSTNLPGTCLPSSGTGSRGCWQCILIAIVRSTLGLRLQTIQLLISLRARGRVSSRHLLLHRTPRKDLPLVGDRMCTVVPLARVLGR